MPTARTLISASLRQLGVVATGEVPTAAEADDALDLLNEMLEAWSLESYAVIAETLTTHTLTALQASYTVGSGGNIAIDWPLQIDQAQLRVTSVVPNLDLPIRVLNEQEYALIRLKTQQSTYVQAVWLHTTFPLATLFVWPIPTDANDLILWTKGVVASFATLDTSVTLGRGYARAIRCNLLLELAPEHGRIVTPNMLDLARESLATVKRGNTKPRLAFIDVPAGQGRDYGSYNWRDDRGA